MATFGVFPKICDAKRILPLVDAMNAEYEYIPVKDDTYELLYQKVIDELEVSINTEKDRRCVDETEDKLE